MHSHLVTQIPLSIVASIGVCHIPDQGSITREGVFALFRKRNRLYYSQCVILAIYHFWSTPHFWTRDPGSAISTLRWIIS